MLVGIWFVCTMLVGIVLVFFIFVSVRLDVVFAIVLWTMHLLDLIGYLITMLFGYIFTFFLRIVAAFLPRCWNTARGEIHLISIITNSFWNWSAMFGIDILLDLLRLRPLFQFAYLFLFIMTILLFAGNRNFFSQLFAYLFLPVLTIFHGNSTWSLITFCFISLFTVVTWIL